MSPDLKKLNEILPGKSVVLTPPGLDTDLLCAATILSGILLRSNRTPNQELATQIWDYVQCLKDEQNRRLNGGK